MGKKAIALKGRGNVGKTETIKMVYTLLLDKYPNAPREHELANGDVRSILTIHGIKIGIESRGDPTSRLPESLALFRKEGCHIILCATRTYGQTCDTVNELEGHGYEITWFRQEIEDTANERELANRAMAQRLLAEIENAMLKV
jgi:hypothetical protein